MKFCPVVPEICHGQVHVPKKKRRKRKNNNNNNNNKKGSKNNKSPILKSYVIKMATPRFACHSVADIEAILNHLLFFC